MREAAEYSQTVLYEGNDPRQALQGMHCMDFKHVPTS